MLNLAIETWIALAVILLVVIYIAWVFLRPQDFAHDDEGMPPFTGGW